MHIWPSSTRRAWRRAARSCACWTRASWWTWATTSRASSRSASSGSRTAGPGGPLPARASDAGAAGDRVDAANRRIVLDGDRHARVRGRRHAGGHRAARSRPRSGRPRSRSRRRPRLRSRRSRPRCRRPRMEAAEAEAEEAPEEEPRPRRDRKSLGPRRRAEEASAEGFGEGRTDPRSADEARGAPDWRAPGVRSEEDGFPSGTPLSFRLPPVYHRRIGKEPESSYLQGLCATSGRSGRRGACGPERRLAMVAKRMGSSQRPSCWAAARAGPGAGDRARTVPRAEAGAGGTRRSRCRIGVVVPLSGAEE